MTRSEFKTNLGLKLKSARALSGLSLAEVAARCETSRAAIREYENGIKEPSAWVLSRLSVALKACPIYLLS